MRVTASSEFAPASKATIQPVARQRVTGRPIRRRWLSVVLWGLGVVAAFTCYLRLAETRAVNSDGAAQALQAWDMLHGNLLLHGWALTDITMYTTELPEYMLVELVRGLNTDVVHVAAAVTYTLVVVLAALVAKGHATGRAALVRVLITVGIMFVPQLAEGINILISSPDHIGTSVPLLLLWLVIDRAGPRWYVPVVATVVLAWATFADSLVLLIGVLPLALVCAVRVMRAVGVRGQSFTAQWYELGLGGGALVGGGAAWLALHHIPGSAFTLTPTSARIPAPPDMLAHHVNVAAQGLLLLGGADFFGQPFGFASAVMVLHLVGVALAALGVLVALAQFARGKDLIDDVLVSAVIFNVIAYALSTLAIAVYASREFDPVLPFAAVLAGRVLADRVLKVRFLPAVLLVVLAGYLGGLGYELAQPPVPAQNQQLASWLEQHHLDRGLSGYWESSIVTLATNEQVRILQLRISGQRVAPYVSEANVTWFDSRHNTANFVVLAPTIAEDPGFNGRRQPEYGGFADKPAVFATFGRPARVYHDGPYQILVYNKNLLTDLAPVR
jgi:hypothetical protein